MSTPHYIIKKFGDQYIPILQGSYPRMTRCAFFGWGMLLILLSSNRRGLSRRLLFVAGIVLAFRGVHDLDQVGGLRSWFSRLVHCNGKGVYGPSYPSKRANRASQLPVDLVDEQAMESFPASDAPARGTSVRT